MAKIECSQCGYEIIEEPHYDCEAELKQIRQQEDRGDMEWFAPGGGAEAEAYYGDDE